MKSTASFNGHPIHPILIAFPIAFFTGAVIFDIIALATDRVQFALTAKYLDIAGIISALAAAVPGIIDYFYSVPPKSSAKTRATKHGLTNITAVLVFVIALIMRYHAVTLAAILALEIVGVILIGIAGYMGGTLVYRNQIGVYNRYANKGFWKDVRAKQASGSIEVAAAGELKTDQMMLVHAGGKRIIVARTDNGYVAFDDRCTHKGGSLAGGALICGTVQCPWHGSQFDVTTGQVKAGPATEKISTYPIMEKEGKLYLEL